MNAVDMVLVLAALVCAGLIVNFWVDVLLGDDE